MEIQISQETCCTCNVNFWITEEHQKRLKSCKNTFFCPNGHRQSYKGKTKDQIIEELKSNLRFEKDISASINRSNSALRGVITRNKRKNT